MSFSFVQREGTGEAEKKPQNQDGANSTKEEKVGGNVKAEAKDSTPDLCELSMEDDLLLLREDEEEDFGKWSGKGNTVWVRLTRRELP